MKPLPVSILPLQGKAASAGTLALAVVIGLAAFTALGRKNPTAKSAATARRVVKAPRTTPSAPIPGENG